MGCLLCAREDLNLHELPRRNLKTQDDAESSQSEATTPRTSGTGLPSQGSAPFQDPSAPFPDPVEVALSEALTRASEAGQWDVVAKLADELRARRGSVEGKPRANEGEGAEVLRLVVNGDDEAEG